MLNVESNTKPCLIQFSIFCSKVVRTSLGLGLGQGLGLELGQGLGLDLG